MNQIGYRYKNNHDGMNQSNFISQKTYMKPSHPVPTVSIVTPTKNRLRLLTEAMDSVAAQTNDNWEHLIVDDGSDDGTEPFVKTKAAADSRVRFIKREGTKSGANVCRNIGIRASRGAFVVFLDSDDLLSPDCLSDRVNIMQRNQDLHFCIFRAGIFRIEPNDTTILWHTQSPGSDLDRFLQHECVWDVTGPIWRRDVFDQFGFLDDSLLSMQDFEFHVRVLAKNASYIKQTKVDHYIRRAGREAFPMTSQRRVSDPTFLRAREAFPSYLLKLLEEGNLVTRSRRDLLAGRGFTTAQCWARIGSLYNAYRCWRIQRRAGLPTLGVYLCGCLCLCLTRFEKSERGILFRLVNKWMGWVRFRLESKLDQNPDEKSTCEANNIKCNGTGRSFPPISSGTSTLEPTMAAPEGSKG